ncbi:MAG: PaaI family thioesterase [Firmicutes bacterium]|nr:PaaI family thioesterase [Bacillota bacterium]
MTNEQMLELAKNTINETPGFIKHNNYKVEEVTNEYCKMSVELTENAINPNGTAHGGLIFGLADTTMGVLARTTGRNIVTINAQIDYLKPGKGNKITCIAEPLKVGKSTAVYRASIYNEEETLISTVTGTFFFLD